MRRLTFVFLLMGGLISAQEDAVFKVGGGISQPRLISKIEPEYSEEARLLGANSTVVLSLVVGKDGSTRDIKVARRSGFGLDEKAVNAVARWRFQPGNKENTPVNVYATVEVNFRLLDRVEPIPSDPLKTAMPTARITYSPEGATPVAISGRLPRHESPTRVTFHLTFDVNHNGDVENLICAEAAPDSMLDEIRKIRFLPATSGGQPIRSTARLEISY